MSGALGPCRPDIASANASRSSAGVGSKSSDSGGGVAE